MAELPEVKAAVEANHDENRWWPTTVADPRLRMAVAGWSTRVSYAMVDTYARVVAQAVARGFDELTRSSDADLSELVAPLGLRSARVAYFRSLTTFLEQLTDERIDPLRCDADALIGRFAGEVAYASFKVAQCAALYSRGYHCGVMPVDAGMVSRLAPTLGLELPAGPVAHEWMRHQLEASVRDRAADYRRVIQRAGYAVTVPPNAEPSWWLHLVLIYFKRLHLNRPNPRLCQRRPVCARVLDCRHSAA